MGSVNASRYVIAAIIFVFCPPAGVIAFLTAG